MSRKHTLGAITSIFAALALSACAAAVKSAPPTTARLESQGLSTSRVAVDGESALDFVNSDEKAHQIYSNDCPELSSTVIQPGQVYVAQLGDGPKTCHFEDLLDPLAPAFRGTVDVGEAPERPLDEYLP